MDWNYIRHFKPFEFDSPDAPGSGSNMNIPFVMKLDQVRQLVGEPLSVHSGYRTPAHNAKVGGVDSSAHESGHAADIGALSSQLKFKVLHAAVQVGFKRIGIGSSFIHLDDDPLKPQDVVWTYPQSSVRS